MNNDLISREALKKAIMELPNDNPSYYYTGYFLDREMVLDEIGNAPTVVNEKLTSDRPQVDGNSDRLAMQQGKWIRKVDEVGFISHICSECGAEIEVEDCSDDKFCFNCGAKMRGGAEEW